MVASLDDDDKEVHRVGASEIGRGLRRQHQAPLVDNAKPRSVPPPQ